MKKSSKNYMVLALAGVIIACIFFLFLNYLNYEGEYVISENNKYFSDFSVHLYQAQKDGFYSLLSVIFCVLMKLFNSHAVLALFMTLIVCADFVINYFFIKRIFASSKVDFSQYTIKLLAISLVFVCSTYIPFIYPKFYNTFTLVTQPWHNTTYLFVRPFATSVMYMYYITFRNYTDHIEFKQYAIFTAIMFIMVSIKPSIIVVFAPYLFVICCIDLVKTKGKSFVPALKLGLCILVAIIPLIYQYFLLYGEASPDSLVLSFKRLSNIKSVAKGIISLIVGLAFPMFVSLTLAKNDKNKVDFRLIRSAWYLFIIAYLQRLLIEETGLRKDDGNLAWGMFYFAYFLYMVCITQWICAYKNNNLKSKKEFIIGILLYAASILSGVVYFIFLLHGRPFIL